ALAHLRATGADRRIHELQKGLAEASTDPLTGLPTRRTADRWLAAGGDLTVAVLDVDDLHGINAAHGHAGGDLYLAAIADHLRCAADPADPADLIARLGGDEFTVITRRPADALADAITAAMTGLVLVGASAVPVRVSVGICHISGDPRRALGCADLAMFTAKRLGGGVVHYDPDRDGVPLQPGVRPAVRQRDNHPTRRSASGN
ncbi:MAG TPA: GGDEF domain-containing protein, partial [Asanoa sp.]|nr:GGDEF domain-containing protein [Asanoa sp.]